MNQQVTLNFGIKTCSVMVNNPNDEYEIRELVGKQEIITDLLLPGSKQGYQLKQIKPNEWLIGPLVGIFVSENKLIEILNGRANRVLSLWAKVLEEYNGLAVLFSLERINWEKGTVKGVILQSSNAIKEWVQEDLPIPTVIYDRCFGNKGRRKSIVLRKKCSQLKFNTKVINALPKLGKIEIYSLCSKDYILNPHVPKWDVLNNNNIQIVLENYNRAYIKPDKMSKGKGIIRMTRTADGIVLEQKIGKDNKVHFCKDYFEVQAAISNALNKRMVIQEEIPLLRYEGRPFDFRLLLQKVGPDSWEMTGIAARIFGEGSIVSSPRSGGDVARFEDVITDPIFREEILASMLSFTRSTAEVIEAKYGLFTELGFDLGIDATGKVWLIEVNGKPLKVSIDRLRDHQISTLAYTRPIEYAIYLTGFGGEKDVRARE